MAIGGAIALSRRGSRTALGAAPTVSPGPSTSDALDAVERVAVALYPAVDKLRSEPGDALWSSDDYVPACDVLPNEAAEAINAAILAERSGEPQAYSAKIVAIQAWSLAQIECDDAGSKWNEEAERPVSLV